ncbi:MAG: hypothetical protein LLG06_04510 [Desulfobacteraceae bacterium]|nr:hypothetical protein [Desulfobacteraceae bacterium]
MENDGNPEFDRDGRLISLLEHSLKSLGFRPSVSIEKGGRFVEVEMGSIGPRIIFSLSSDDRHIAKSLRDRDDVRVLNVVDDALPSGYSRAKLRAASLFQSILDSLCGNTDESLRIGADVLFHSVDKNRIQLYADSLEAFVYKSGCGISNSESKYRLTRIEGEEAARSILFQNQAMEDIFALVSSERALLAFDDIDEPAVIVARLALKHCRDLLLDDQNRCSLPLLMLGHQVCARGFLNAVSDALVKAYGVLLDKEILRGALGLGYIHLYISGAEYWRAGSDLDPNTAHFADLFASTGGGRFVLGCCKEDVVQYLSYLDSPGLPGLRTVGDRFRRDLGLSLYDVRMERLEDRDEGWIEAFLESSLSKVSEHICELAQNLVTPAEAVRLLEYLAVKAMSLGGHAVMRHELANIIRGVVLGDRGRVANISTIESSLLISGLFTVHESGHVAFVSEAFHTWLISRIARLSLSAFRDSGRTDLLTQLLREPGLKWWSLDRGIAHAWENKEGGPLPQLLNLLKRFNFFGKRERGETDTVERLNLLRIYQLCLNRHKKDGQTDSVILIDLGNLPWQFINQPMCQFYFKDLNLEGWLFEECDLKNAVFDGCILGDEIENRTTTFKDCFLGGAIFKECEFAWNTSFVRSDLSGTIFIKGGAASDFSRITGEKCLDRINLTASEIQIATGADELAKRLRQNSARLASTNIRVGADASADHVPLSLLSDAYILACARSRWDDRNPFVTPIGRRIYRGADGVRELAQGWDGTDPDAIEIARTEDGREFIVAENPESGLGVALAGGRWTFAPGSKASGNGGAGIKLANAGGEGIFVARCCPSGPLEVWSISASGEGGIALLCREELQRGFRAASLLWLERGDAKAPSGILVGGEDGTICCYGFDGSRIADRMLLRGAEGVPVVAMAHLAKHGVLCFAGKDARVFGYRFHIGGAPLPLFTFQTAHRLIDGFEIHSDSGQILATGPGKGPRQKDGGRTPLFVLANIRGDVLGVWAENDFVPRPGGFAVPAEVPVPAGGGDDFLRSIETFKPNTKDLIYNPVFEEKISVALRSERGALPSWEMVDGRVCYRVCEAVMEETASGPLIDADFEIAEGPSALKLTFRPNLPSKRESPMKMRLDIKYLGVNDSGATEDHSMSISRTLSIQAKHDNNPYIPDGRPAVGSKFFGFEPALEKCIDLLLAGSGMILTAPRRSGKTSFLKQLAHRLTNTHNRVCVLVSGENMKSEETFFESIFEAIVEFENIWPTYRGITRDANPSQRFEMIENVAAAVNRREIHQRGASLVILIDEWGWVRKRALAETALNNFTGMHLPELMNIGVSFCLSSVPSDFPRPKDASCSGDWRHFRRMHIGKLNRDEATDLISRPLSEFLQIASTKEFVDSVLRLTSCAPDDLNRAMYHAVQRAERDFSANPAKARIILPEHLDGYEAMLIPKYEDMRAYIYDAFSREDKTWLLKQAIDKTPLWERVPLLAGTGDEFDVTDSEGNRFSYNPKLVSSLMEFGFQQPLENMGPEEFSKGYKLWVPWGMTIWFRSQAEMEGVA